jgi:hypothetical protein
MRFPLSLLMRFGFPIPNWLTPRLRRLDAKIPIRFRSGLISRGFHERPRALPIDRCLVYQPCRFQSRADIILSGLYSAHTFRVLLGYPSVSNCPPLPSCPNYRGSPLGVAITTNAVTVL